MNNFIIEHSTDTKIILLVPLDHRNIFQAHWANLEIPGLAFKTSFGSNRKSTLPIPTHFFLLQEHYLKWLRALHKTLNEDNVLTHIIFCVDVEAERVSWYLRQFNPCVEYRTKREEQELDWKDELKKVLNRRSKVLRA
jgi:hypothetical protein